MNQLCRITEQSFLPQHRKSLIIMLKNIFKTGDINKILSEYGYNHHTLIKNRPNVIYSTLLLDVIYFNLSSDTYGKYYPVLNPFFLATYTGNPVIEFLEYNESESLHSHKRVETNEVHLSSHDFYDLSYFSNREHCFTRIVNYSHNPIEFIIIAGRNYGKI